MKFQVHLSGSSQECICGVVACAMIRGKEVSDWVPLLAGTLQLQGDGLPSVQQKGWHLMGVRPASPLRVFALVPVTRPQLHGARRNSRASNLKLCLKSLLAQTVRFEAVLIGVPGRGRKHAKAVAGSPGDVPPWLHAWRRRQPQMRVLQIKRHGLGAALVAAATHINDPAAWILGVDATQSYHPLLVETLLRFAAGTPG